MKERRKPNPSRTTNVDDLRHDTGEVELAVATYPASHPLQSGPIRVVILVHGFAGNKSENGLFEHLASDLATDGYSVYCYDARGLGSSNGDYAQTSLDTHVRDFRSIVRFVTERESVEMGQVCAVGFSLGACVVGLAVRSGLIPGAVVHLSPATRPALSMWPRYSTKEILHCLERDGIVQKPNSDVLLGKPILESLRTIDLGERCFDLGLPLLVCHGTSDKSIPIAHTRHSIEKSDSKQTLFREFPGASHSFKPFELHWKDLSATVRNWLGTVPSPQETLETDDSGSNVIVRSL